MREEGSEEGGSSRTSPSAKVFPCGPDRRLSAGGRERPILFSGPMVRALLDGRKTQTRQIVKPQPCARLCGDDFPTRLSGPFIAEELWGQFLWPTADGEFCGFSPYGVPGGRLWVKETLRRSPDLWTYAADGAEVGWPARQALAGKTRDVVTAIHCSRLASRITLCITDVRVERLQDISEADAEAEGAEYGYGHGAKISQRRMYELLWNHINGPSSWDANPWVWVASFQIAQSIGSDGEAYEDGFPKTNPNPLDPNP